MGSRYQGVLSVIPQGLLLADLEVAVFGAPAETDGTQARGLGRLFLATGTDCGHVFRRQDHQVVVNFGWQLSQNTSGPQLICVASALHADWDPG